MRSCFGLIARILPQHAEQRGNRDLERAKTGLGGLYAALTIRGTCSRAADGAWRRRKRRL